MGRAKEIIDITEKYGAHNYHPLPVVLERGEGVWVYDVEGKRYMDMLSSYSAVNQGHRHPKIVAALKEQADKLTLTSRAFYSEPLGYLLKELCDYCGFEMALPMNSGAEAVETAVKIARKWGYRVKGVADERAEIIVCRNNFHGRTITIVSFSTEEQYREGFGPFTPGFKVIEYGCAGELQAAINQNTVAFLVEPIQGEAGILMPPDGYLKEVTRLCREKKILFIADEIQTGFGRTGRRFAYEHDGVKPDMLIVGKALGGGMIPISAALANREVMGVMHPGDHGSTFGGNPLACTVARAALRVLQEERLETRSSELGAYFMAGLRKIKTDKVKEVRGRGLLIGLEIKAEHGRARPYCEKLMGLGLLCKETHESVIRFAPPLVVKKEELDWALEQIAKVL